MPELHGSLKPDNHDEETNENKPKTYEYWRAVKIISQSNYKAKPQYLIQWEDRNLPDTWCDTSTVDDNFKRVFYLTHTETGKRRSENNTTYTTLSMTQITMIPTQELQPKMAINTQNISNQRDLMDDAIIDQIRQKNPVVHRPPTSTNGDSLNLMEHKKDKRPKPNKVAIQILQQKTKDDKIIYFMRWEDPKVQRSWCCADDVTENLKRTFYKNNPLEVAPQIMSMNYTNKPAFHNHSRNGKVMSHYFAMSRHGVVHGTTNQGHIRPTEMESGQT